MTDEQINVVIAEACGITHRNQYGTLYRTKNGWEYNCPDYCTDLNAMHEAQQKLSLNEFVVYIDELMELHHEPMQSTARQRAEAFLRTLGKWEEVQT